MRRAAAGHLALGRHDLGAELLGVERKAAAHFTFYLAVPTMLGASVLELYQKRAELSAANLTTIGIASSSPLPSPMSW
jgi:undecaprenyl pyrophosphate phosphatase UppP